MPNRSASPTARISVCSPEDDAPLSHSRVMKLAAALCKAARPLSSVHTEGQRAPPCVTPDCPEFLAVMNEGSSSQILAQVQVVLMRQGTAAEREQLELHDLQLDGGGRLDWAAVERSFAARALSIVGGGSPVLIQGGPWNGFTTDTCQPGCIITVEEAAPKAPGTSASGTNAELLKMVTACRTLPPIPDSEGILPVTHRCLHWVQASQTDSLVKKLADLSKDREAGYKAFSSASLWDASVVLGHFDFTALVGEDEEPLGAPPAGIPEMGPFPFWNYGDEKAAAGDLAREHKKHLQACGVRMGRGGFGVLDLHDEDDLLELPVGRRCWQGGLDSAVLPYAVAESSAAHHIRVGFMHKQRQEHKDIFAANQAIQGNKQEGTEGNFLESMLPQAIIALVAAVHVNSLPLDLILTDGEENTLLRFKGKEILHHSGLSRRKAYYAVAQRLREHEDVKAMRRRIPEDLVNRLDSSLTEAHRVLIQKLGQAGAAAAEAIKSQLDSVLSSEQSPDERLQATYEILLPWASQMKSGIPKEIRQWYA